MLLGIIKQSAHAPNIYESSLISFTFPKLMSTISFTWVKLIIYCCVRRFTNQPHTSIHSIELYDQNNTIRLYTPPPISSFIDLHIPNEIYIYLYNTFNAATITKYWIYYNDVDDDDILFLLSSVGLVAAYTNI